LTKTKGMVIEMFRYRHRLIELEAYVKQLGHVFPEKVIYATRLMPYVKLKRYRVRFEFEDVKA